MLFVDVTLSSGKEGWELPRECEKWNLKLNVNRSEGMASEGSTVKERKMRLLCEEMENIMVFNHLGSVMSKDGRLDDEIFEGVQQ